MINIYYSSKTETLIWKFKGIITKQDISESIEKIKEYSLIMSRIKIYCDSLNTKLDIETSELNEISQKMHSYINLFEDVKLSVVAESPKITAFFMMTFLDSTDVRLRGKVFSTREAATIWLKEL